jgi:predicted DNA-binding transcriptional regulator AlpA
MTYITIEQMAEILQERFEYVRDKVVKRADFPRPALVLSRKVVKWSQDDWEKWLEKKRKEWAR